jgi:hypothetical protein
MPPKTRKTKKTKTTVSQRQSVRQTVIIHTEAAPKRRRSKKKSAPSTQSQLQQNVFMPAYSQLLNSINTIYDKVNRQSMMREVEAQAAISRKTTGTSTVTEVPAAESEGTPSETPESPKRSIGQRIREGLGGLRSSASERSGAAAEVRQFVDGLSHEGRRALVQTFGGTITSVSGGDGVNRILRNIGTQIEQNRPKFDEFKDEFKDQFKKKRR